MCTLGVWLAMWLSAVPTCLATKDVTVFGISRSMLRALGGMRCDRIFPSHWSLSVIFQAARVAGMWDIAVAVGKRPTLLELVELAVLLSNILRQLKVLFGYIRGRLERAGLGRS
ncbi:hypothetical protein N658DRAFT_502351 [Parathielavia hyrcaniae]|uniref:Secreted protein n=1 Tax=Parathielavia hyrcaniae TaxID=113614 RepID=A0AAN6PTG2_9PEZI|nr:hypothetical protein N658DRAFT_502351 [Parathielavia hyrcaniae]